MCVCGDLQVLRFGRYGRCYAEYIMCDRPFLSKAGACYGLSFKTVLFGLINVARSFVGGLFPFSPALDIGVSRLLPHHHLSDEICLMRHVGAIRVVGLSLLTVVGGRSCGCWLR